MNHACDFCDGEKNIVDMVTKVYVPCPKCCPPSGAHLSVEIESGIMQAERMERKVSEISGKFSPGTNVSRRLKIAEGHAKAMAGALRVALKELGVS